MKNRRNGQDSARQFGGCVSHNKSKLAIGEACFFLPGMTGLTGSGPTSASLLY
ncbi:MAG: hypothetical protein KF752_08345 [Pirellulaceae bacterium]|nr:hypothetical protein [Pirellulaceae bacterium]